jgi:putative transposase
VEHQRLQLANEYLRQETSMTDLCKKFGISRKTGYKWVERFVKSGVDGLQDLSREPHNNKQQCFTSKQIDTAINLKCRYRTWGPKKIIAKLYQLYPNQTWPSPTRLYEIFKDHHLVTSKRIKGRVPATAPLGMLTGCNDTWSVDFKGWFLTNDGFKCEPLTISDCHSRYLIRCVHLNKHTVEYVWPIFAEAFKEFGLPNRIRSDNGPPFGSVGVGRLTGLSVNLIKAGVIPEWIKPGHPEENGRHERMHLTLKQDIASPPKSSLVEQIQALHDFRDMYNFERPHEALSMKTPADCYYTSDRVWDGILRSPEYDRSKMDVRKVGQSGCIWIHQKEYYIGQTLTGEYVGLKTKADEVLELYFGPVYLGLINILTNKGLERPKLKTRRQR